MAGSTSFHGIENITFALTDDAGELLTGANGVSDNGVFLVDGDGQGATEANITGLEEAGTIQSANNKNKRVSHGKPQPQVAITMLDMPFGLLQRLKGFSSDGKGGYTPTSGRKPHVAMLIKTTGFDGEDYYEGFANGELIEPGHSHGTDTNTETDANTVLTYQALTPIKSGVFIDNKGKPQSFKTWTAIDSGFTEAAMLKEVFGGFSGTLDMTNAGGDADTNVATSVSGSGSTTTD